MFFFAFPLLPPPPQHLPYVCIIVCIYIYTSTGKYKCLRPNASQVQAEAWQYWVDDGVNGKADGWYDYDDDGALVVEQLHAE